jgi:hypothetical protein
MHPLAALDDAGAVGIQLLHVGEWMQMMSGIDGGEIGARVSIRHDLLNTLGY